MPESLKDQVPDGIIEVLQRPFHGGEMGFSPSGKGREHTYLYTERRKLWLSGRLQADV